jgi:hypothetical protein
VKTIETLEWKLKRNIAPVPKELVGRWWARGIPKKETGLPPGPRPSPSARTPMKHHGDRRHRPNPGRRPPCRLAAKTLGTHHGATPAASARMMPAGRWQRNVGLQRERPKWKRPARCSVDVNVIR